MPEILAAVQAPPANTGDDQIERLVRAGVSAGTNVSAGPVWLMVTPDRPGQLAEHGWKLHLSSTVSAFPALVARVLPILASEACPFKLARSLRVLDELNDGITSPATVGKAVTVYPDKKRVRELGMQLAVALAGCEGPRILSDRRVSADAPVYYRYGPFLDTSAANSRGDIESWMHGPGGQRFAAVATLRYEQPPWADDPFTAGAGPSAIGHSEGSLVGGRYLILAGIAESARGNVFRASDRRDGLTVIVKQARAHVSEDSSGIDARMRLRNERRICQVLAGVPGVPRCLDHFRHGDDEFLVTTDCGARTLVEDVLRSGPYLVRPGSSGRGLTALARQLAVIVGAVHERGVIIGDLAPSNVVLDGQRASLIDFGLAGHDGLHLRGGTPGYATARQLRGETVDSCDDLYSLGMTLLFAATRLHPVTLGDDDDVALVRARQAIRARFGPRPVGVAGAVADLLEGGAPARRALALLADGQRIRLASSAAAMRDSPVVTTELAARVRSSLLIQLTTQVQTALAAPEDSHLANDAALYTGAAGVGIELLHHRQADGVAECVDGLTAMTALTARRVGLSAGLFTGRTGVDLFLQLAADQGVTPPRGWDGPEILNADFRPEGDDLIVGAAGVGLGHVMLFRAGGDDRHRAAAHHCASLLTAQIRPESSFGLNPEPEPGTSPSWGQAHGVAGVTYFLATIADQENDPVLAAAAARLAGQLGRHAVALIRSSGGIATSPLAASWCQGLAGIGRTLAHAGCLLRDDRLARIARRSADACIALLPRMGALGQCCGAAGVGNFLIDLAEIAQEPRYLAAAGDVAGHILSRSGGPPDGPVITEDGLACFSMSWATGLAGVLGFFRRLAAQGEPDILPVPGRREDMAGSSPV